MPLRIKGGVLNTGLVTIARTASWAGPLSYTITGHWDRKTTVGVDLKHFYRRKLRGDLLPHTDFSQFEGKLDYSPGTYYGKILPNGAWTNYSSYIPGGYNWPLDEGDNNLASKMRTVDPGLAAYHIQSAAAAIQSRGWDVLTFASELPKLISQVRGIAKKFVNMSAGHTSERLMQLWMEGRYGWRTLAYDIKDLSEAITEYDAKRTIYSERRGTSYGESWDSSSSFTTNEGTIEQTWVFTQNNSIRGSVAARITPPKFEVNPLKTAWELTRLSWMLDWVLDVGTAIDAFNFTRCAVEQTASYGIHRTFTGSLSVTKVTPVSGRSLTASYSGTCEIQTTKRVPSSIPSLPQLTGRNLSPEMSIDLLALMRSRMRLK